MAGAERSFAWKYEISLGNVMSALTMLITATVFIVSIRSSGQLEMTELRGEMKVYSARLEQINHDFNDFKTSSQQANTELRTKLDSVSSAISDMRVLIAGKQHTR